MPFHSSHKETLIRVFSFHTKHLEEKQEESKVGRDRYIKDEQLKYDGSRASTRVPIPTNRRRVDM